MRQLTKVFCHVWSNPGNLMNQITLKRAICVLALAGVTFTYASAKEPGDGNEPGSKIKRTGAPASAAEAAIPACLEKLKLSQPQQTEVKEIVRKYDVSLDAVWKQFGEKYMETVRTEVALLAAIEDNLTEPQRMQVHAQRRKVAHAEKALEGTISKPNQATAKPADAAEQATAGISLTSEQEAAADQIHQKYVGQLRSLNRDIQGLHTRLVSLEADKLVEIEKTLTKEQLAQLREGRLNVPAGAKVTSTTR
jgi:hypothetical protein